MCRDKTNVKPEMYDYTSNNCIHWISNEKLKEKLLLLLLLFMIMKKEHVC